MKKITYLLLMMTFSNPMIAQNDENYLGTWSILNVRFNFSPKWSVFGETQLRSLRPYHHFHYYEFKGALEYRLSPIFFFALGAGDYNTYQRGGNFVEPKSSDEIRIWQQLIVNQKLEKMKFEHRYRAEQRFQLTGLRNRFRYRFSCVIPLNSPTFSPKTWFLNISDEIFFTDIPPYFERNRFFLGVGYRFSENLTLQGGWLRQFDYRLVDETGYNFFQFSCLVDLK